MSPERTRPFECLDQPEVGDLDAVGDHEQVARLDVEVLEVVLLDQVVEPVGGVVEEAEQDVAGDARPARPAGTRRGSLVQVLVGQLHDDDEFAADVLDLLDGEDERVADLLDALERLHLLLGAGAVAVERVQVAVDELDGLVDAAGRHALPHLAEPAGAEGLDQPVAGDRLGVRLAEPVHRGECLPPASGHPARQQPPHETLYCLRDGCRRYGAEQRR